MTLSDFFQSHKKLALAYSGGVDSAYLLFAALRYGADVRAYFVKTPFQPQFELDDAMRLAAELHAKLSVLEEDVFDAHEITANTKERCYFCKKRMLMRIAKAANADGYSLLIDGTNASDNAGDRPGMRALCELSVRSPLFECGITKEKIRQLSREAGLFTWNKPAYACLATRIPTDTPITKTALEITEAAENELYSLGFGDFRIRMLGDAAKIQLRAEELDLFMEKRQEILAVLKKYYSSVMLDLEVRE